MVTMVMGAKRENNSVRDNSDKKQQGEQQETGAIVLGDNGAGKAEHRSTYR